jgi:hypothetical protein
LYSSYVSSAFPSNSYWFTAAVISPIQSVLGKMPFC